MARTRPWLIGVIVAGVVLWGGGAAHANQLVGVTIPAAPGQIGSQWLSYSGPPRANVLLPTGYDPRKAYPLLIFLHGLGGDYNSFAASGMLRELAGLDAIVVMPEGASGWYADWWNDGERGSPSWESYELDEVLPYVLSHYRIRPQRRWHAIAGISMGGLGATYLGGRLPGFFGSVATLSGFVDPQLSGFAGPPLFGPLVGEAEALTALAPLKGDLDLSAVEGPVDGFYATGHNPTALVGNLRHTRLFASTGTGNPSAASGTNLLAGLSGLLAEKIIYPMNRAYHEALVAAGVRSTYQAHLGGHDVPDFIDEVRAMLAWGLFKPVVSQPRSWSNETVATAGQLWDIGYRFDSPPSAIVSFDRSGRSLSVSAAGSAVTVRTAGGCTLHVATPVTVTLPRHC